MFLKIHTEDVWLVPLIKIYTKALFGPYTNMYYLLSEINLSFFSWYIMVEVLWQIYIF